MALDGKTRTFQHLAQAVGIGLGHALSGEATDEGFQDSPYGIDLLDAGAGQRTDDHAFARGGDKLFLLQSSDGFSNGDAADAELLGNFGLHEVLAGTELPLDDGLFEALVDHLAQRRVAVDGGTEGGAQACGLLLGNHCIQYTASRFFVNLALENDEHLLPTAIVVRSLASSGAKGPKLRAPPAAPDESSIPSKLPATSTNLQEVVTHAEISDWLLPPGPPRRPLHRM